MSKLASVVLGLLLCPGAAWGLTGAIPVYPVRVTANGFAALTVNGNSGKVDGFWPHLYAHRSPAETTPNLLFDAYFGLQVGAGKAVWAPTLPIKPGGSGGGTNPGYGAGSCVHDVRVSGDVQLETVTCAPMTLPAAGAVMLARTKNVGKAPQTVGVAALGNFHLGPPTSSQDSTPGMDGESITVADDRTLVEKNAGTAHRILYRALGPTPDALEATNPWQKWQDGTAFLPSSSPAGLDRVAGMQWPGQTLQPGEEAVVGWLLLYGDNTSEGAMQTAADVWVNGRGPDDIYGDESKDWEAWHQLGKATVPPGVDQVWMQRQMATLRVAQVREPNWGAAGQNQTPNGQLVASLPPGIWHIAWVRDMAYAGVALAAGGHWPEARAALDFVLNGQTGGYESYFGGPYLISPVRYYGGGLEESDTDQNGPNIEFDGPGLWLWQAARYLKASGDVAWLQQNWPVIRDLVANRLVALRDPTGLLGKDSGPWEVHWNGKQKHFTYSTLVGIRGLCGAADLADLLGEPAQAQAWRNVAVAMRQSVLSHMVGADNVLRGNMEEPAGLALDAAAVEAFLDGQMDAGGPIAWATWQAWKQKLLAAGVGPGLARNDDGGQYDSAEWLFIDLRVLRMLERMVAAGQPVAEDLAALQARMADVATAGGGMIPELLGTQTGNVGLFDGAIPMVGFGAGAMALWLGGEAWGDDLAGCFAVPAVVEPGPDAGSTPEVVDTVDAAVDLGEAETTPETDVADPPDAAGDLMIESDLTTIDWLASDAAALTDASGALAEAVGGKEAGNVGATRSSSPGCGAAMTPRSGWCGLPSLWMFVGGLAVLWRRRRTCQMGASA